MLIGINYYLSGMNTFPDKATIRTLIKERDNLVQVINEANAKLKRVNKALSALTAESLAPNQWTKQAIVCLTHNQKMMTNAEILECLYFDNPEELNDKDKRRMLMTGLSVALGNMCESKVLFKRSAPGERGYYYGLSAWLEEDRETIKKKYKQDKFLSVGALVATGLM